MEKVIIIGAGLAGCECAYHLANNEREVILYEMKPTKRSAAHELDTFAELVCSNSLKAETITNACGLLKKEMSLFGSLMVEAAYVTRVEAGQALAVNTEQFSKYITDKIKSHPNITIHYQEVTDIHEVMQPDTITIIATGPLTTDSLSNSIKKLIGEDSLFFYDAVAPIIEADSIDEKIAYRLDRYQETNGDYLNLPMTKEQYLLFYHELIQAEVADRHSFDKLLLFEGCMPIEEMARKGEKTLTFGMLKPVGLNHPVTNEKYYAVAQLRAENKERTAYNLVGFQTSLKWKEQQRVFSLIPGLENARFLRYGVMHRNTYIQASKVLTNNFSMKSQPNVYFAGQISGVEGYVESAASGLMVAISILARSAGSEIVFPETTMMGSLAKYISTPNDHFQPMNANFGILKPLEVEQRIKDKKIKYTMLAERSLNDLTAWSKLTT